MKGILVSIFNRLKKYSGLNKDTDRCPSNPCITVREAIEIADRIEELERQLAEKDAEIERLKTVPMKYRRMAFNAQLQNENEELRQQLDTFNSAVEHVTENGKTKRSFSSSEGWAMVHKDRLLDLECAEEQLAASQAREAQLREALESVAKALIELKDSFAERGARPETPGKREMWDLAWSSYEKLLEVTNQPVNTTALDSLIAKAGEVMRVRCLKGLASSSSCFTASEVHIKNLGDKSIRALPGVTIEELK